MNRKSSKAPLLEPPDAIEPTQVSGSAAHDALQDTLDNSTSLKKKTSWLNFGGNIRRGIKGVIDYVRGDIAAADEAKPPPSDTTSQMSFPAQAKSESAGEALRSSTPTKSLQRHNTFSPKAMATSLRNAFPRQHSHRGSISKSTYNSLDDEDGSPRGPEQMFTDGQDDPRPTTHRLHTSLAGTLVGSIRNRRFSRAMSLKRLTPGNIEDLPTSSTSPTKPIDIPSSTTPHLSLNLSPLGTMSPPFGVRRDSKADCLDLNEITSGLPDDRGICVPPELEASAKTREQLSTLRLVPSDLTLHLPPPALESGWLDLDTSRNLPTTPMPGTNLSLELDGNDSEKSAVFERSVESPSASVKKSDHTLRQVRSIDAFARGAPCSAAPHDSANDSLEALASAAEVAHVADELEQHWTQGTMDALDVASHDALGLCEEECLSPQILEVDCSSPQQPDDISMDLDGTPTIDLIPAPLEIPQRAKPHRDLLSQTTISTCPSEMESIFPCATPRRDIVQPTDFRPESDREDYAESYRSGHHKGKTAVSNGHNDLALNLANRVRHPRDDDLATEDDEQIIDQLHSPHQADDTDSIVTDYDEFKTQLFFPTDDASSIDLPNYNYANSMSGSPSNKTPLVPVLARAVNSSHESSPASGRVSGIRSTDVGGLMYKFTINSWLGNASDGEAHGPSTLTPHQVTESLDGESETTEVACSFGDPFTDPIGRPPSPSSQPDEDAGYKFHPAVPTSSPACLTEWEKQNFQVSVPAQAHELTCGSSAEKSSPLVAARRERVWSDDTLDDTLARFSEHGGVVMSSPQSGYEADESGPASDGTSPQPETPRFHFRGFVGGME